VEHFDGILIDGLAGLSLCDFICLLTFCRCVEYFPYFNIIYEEKPVLIIGFLWFISRYELFDLIPRVASLPMTLPVRSFRLATNRTYSNSLSAKH